MMLFFGKTKDFLKKSGEYRDPPAAASLFGSAMHLWEKWMKNAARYIWKGDLEKFRDPIIYFLDGNDVNQGSISLGRKVSCCSSTMFL